MSRSGHTHGFPDEEPDWLARITKPEPWWRRKVFSIPEAVLIAVLAHVIAGFLR